MTCTKYCLKMALTCKIYENNFISEVRERPFNLKGGLWFYSRKIF